MRLLTIGYEGLSISKFLGALTEYSVSTVVDVRETPLSRKPGFSKKALAGLLAETNIDYRHLKELGCPKSIRDGYKKDHDWGTYCFYFKNYLQGQDRYLHQVESWTDEESCALLCFEADFKCCHRSLIAEAIHYRTGMPVGHIRPTDFL